LPGNKKKEARNSPGGHFKAEQLLRRQRIPYVGYGVDIPGA